MASQATLFSCSLAFWDNCSLLFCIQVTLYSLMMCVDFLSFKNLKQKSANLKSLSIKPMSLYNTGKKWCYSWCILCGLLEINTFQLLTVVHCLLSCYPKSGICPPENSQKEVTIHSWGNQVAWSKSDCFSHSMKFLVHLCIIMIVRMADLCVESSLFPRLTGKDKLVV